VLFLPPNAISLCPSMDQGVITMLKKIYHHRLLILKSLIEVTDRFKMLENVKKINLKDFVYWTAQAWEQSEHNDQESNFQKRKTN
jgi:hypothetical protein